MDRRLLITGIAAGAAALSRPALAAEDDARAVRAVVDEMAAGWNAGDAARMFRLATDDVEWINIMGMYWRGKAQVQAAHAVILSRRYKGVTKTVEQVEAVRPLGDAAVLAVVRWSLAAFTAPDGAAIPAMQNRLTLVLTRTPEGLRFVHAANIEVNARAAAADPARQTPR